VFATGAITAVFHMGGEYKWWSLPATCVSSGSVDLESLTALALGTGPAQRVAMCDSVAWSWLGLSMAGWNALISLALAGFSLLATKRPKDARAPRFERA
jgi:disulfide bond formation protein DsbB